MSLGGAGMSIACEECMCRGFVKYAEYMKHKEEQHGWSEDGWGGYSQSSIFGTERWDCKICKGAGLPCNQFEVMKYREKPDGSIPANEDDINRLVVSSLEMGFDVEVDDERVKLDWDGKRKKGTLIDKRTKKNAA